MVCSILIRTSSELILYGVSVMKLGNYLVSGCQLLLSCYLLPFSIFLDFLNLSQFTFKTISLLQKYLLISKQRRKGIIRQLQLVALIWNLG